MSSDRPEPLNPYASPAPVDPSQLPPGHGFPAVSDELQQMLKKFRQQTLALGVLWILFGFLSSGLGVFFLVAPNTALADRVAGADRSVLLLMGAILIPLGLLQLGAGISALMKKMPGVVVGLVVTYVNLLGNVLQFNLCAIVIGVLIVIQAHRVLGYAKKLRQAGVPLDTKNL